MPSEQRLQDRSYGIVYKCRDVIEVVDIFPAHLPPVKFSGAFERRICQLLRRLRLVKLENHRDIPFLCSSRFACCTDFQACRSVRDGVRRESIFRRNFQRGRIMQGSGRIRRKFTDELENSDEFARRFGHHGRRENYHHAMRKSSVYPQDSRRSATLILGG